MTIRILRSKIGDHYSIMLTLPNGEQIEGDLRPSGRRILQENYDLVAADQQDFETAVTLEVRTKTEG